MNRSQTNKKRKKVSPIDIVIALIFVVALAATVYLAIVLMADDSVNANKDGVSADCRLVIENVDVERFDITLNEVTGGVDCEFLKVGDQVYDPESGKSVGRITAIAYELSTASSGEVDEEGNLIFVEYPGHIDLVVTLRTELEAENDYTVGSLNLRLGQEVLFRTASYEAKAVVSDMKTGVN